MDREPPPTRGGINQLTSYCIFCRDALLLVAVSAVSFLSSSLSLVVPPAVSPLQLAVRVPAASAVVPAIVPTGIFPQPTVPRRDKQLTEEEQIARDGARRIAAIVLS